VEDAGHHRRSYILDEMTDALEGIGLGKSPAALYRASLNALYPF
jgi:hypothetical protein